MKTINFIPLGYRMITRWSSLSSGMIIFSLVGVIHFYPSVLLCWVLIEILTWSVLFLFFHGWGKQSLSSLFIFFLVQRICGFYWLVRASIISVINNNSNYIMYLIIFISLIIKIGLMPGYNWALSVYKRSSLVVILALSSLLKLLPLIVLYLRMNTCLVRLRNGRLFFLVWALISFFLVFINLNARSRLQSFLFFSGIMNFTIMILLLLFNLYNIFFIYFLRYRLSLLLFLVMYFRYNVKRLQFGPSLYQNKTTLLLLYLRAAGYPPFPTFWLKIIALYHLWKGGVVLTEVLTWVLSSSLVLYLITLIMSSAKVWSDSKKYTYWDLVRVQGGTTAPSSELITLVLIIILPLIPIVRLI